MLGNNLDVHTLSACVCQPWQEALEAALEAERVSHARDMEKLSSTIGIQLNTLKHDSNEHITRFNTLKRRLEVESSECNNRIDELHTWNLALDSSIKQVVNTLGQQANELEEVRSMITQITEPLSCDEHGGFTQAGAMVLRLKAFCAERGLILNGDDNHSINLTSLDVIHAVHKAWLPLTRHADKTSKHTNDVVKNVTEQESEQIHALMDCFEAATVECKARFDELNIAQNELSQQLATNLKESERLEKMIVESYQKTEGIVEHWITAFAHEISLLGRVLEKSISNTEQHSMRIHELECRNSFHDVEKITPKAQVPHGELAFWHRDRMPLEEVSTTFGRRCTSLEFVAEVEEDELSDDLTLSLPVQVRDDGLSSQIEKLQCYFDMEATENKENAGE